MLPSPPAHLRPILDGMTPEQITAARASGPVLVLAGAGSGKTRSLTAGVACRIGERNIPADRLLVVTFTNKATGEMRDRVRAVLGVGAAPSWLGTFHGLGARQLRLEPEIAGLRANFDILDAGESARIVKRLLTGMRPVEPGVEDEDGTDLPPSGSRRCVTACRASRTAW